MAHRSLFAPPSPLDLRAIFSVLILMLLVGCSRAPLPTSPDAAALVAQRTSNSGDADGEVVATLAPGASAAVVAADYGATVGAEEELDCATFRPGGQETPLQLAGRLGVDPRIVTAEPNGYLESPESRQESWAFDDGFGNPETYREQNAAAALHLADAHRVSKGRNVLVAILDTGADLSHPALAGRIAGGWDFVDGDADPRESGDGVDNDGDGLMDEALGHGTHVAGLVALVAPQARLLVIRVLDADGRGDMRAIAVGIRWAVAQGADVINLSLGSTDNSDAVQDALDEAEDAGVVSVAAAGNRGSENPREYPARSSHAHAIAAVDDQGRVAAFSSYGDHVALSAPGVALRSSFPNGRYLLWSGTSMSTPLVAGAAALLRSVHSQWGTEQVMSRLGGSARPVTGAGSYVTEQFGRGMLDVGAALAPDAYAAGGGGSEVPIDPMRPHP